MIIGWDCQVVILLLGILGIIQCYYLLIGLVNFLCGGVIFQGCFLCIKIFYLQIMFVGMICEFVVVNNLGGIGLFGIVDNVVGVGFCIFCGLNKWCILRYLIWWLVCE